MLFLAAAIISVTAGALAGLVLHSFSLTTAFLPTLLIVSVLCLLAIGVFNASSKLIIRQAMQQPKPNNSKNKPAAKHQQKAQKSQKPGKTSKSKPAATASASELEQGTVKWFNGNKGFGFIRRSNGDEVFVHFRSITTDSDGGRRYLREGQEVKFRVVDSDRGPQAEDVELA